LYVGEVTWTFGINRGGIPDDCPTTLKLARVG
jgi:hypothetical protein